MKLRKAQHRFELRPKTTETIAQQEAPTESKHDQIRNMVRQQWDEFMAAIKAQNRRPAPTHINIAYTLYTFFPERRDELQLTDELWEDAADDAIASMQGHFYLNTIKSLVALYPEKRSELPMDRIRQHAMALITEYQNDQDWINFADASSLAIMIFPDLKKELTIDNETRQGMIQAANNKRGRDFANFPIWAEAVLITCPECRDALNIDVPTIEKIDSLIANAIETVYKLNLMRALATLTADTINPTEDGIRTSSDNSIQQTPALPTRKTVS